MPAVSAYRRAPLVNLSYTPMSDAAVHTDGLQQRLCKLALDQANPSRLSPLDAVLATKLGGYTEAPAMPALDRKEDTRAYVENLCAGAMISAMARDKQGMLDVLEGVKAFHSLLPSLSEEQLFYVGADALRLTMDLYRRTGQPFLLNLMEDLRSRLPDVSGVMHMFPFQRAYQPEKEAHAAEEAAYYARMQRFATGKYMADALAMTALLSQYSGSGRDAAASRAGLVALMRYHGMPSGAFSADPYLAGRDPARALELDAACAQTEAYLDALLTTGDVAMADALERMMQNVLPDLLSEKGVRTLSPTNRLASDDSCQWQKPSRQDLSALLRALYAVRCAVWLARDDASLCYMLPLDGGCLTRLNGVPVRLTARVEGCWQRKVTLRVECKQPVSFTLHLHVPGYADGARVSVNGGRTQEAAPGELCAVSRTFQTGDTVTLQLDVTPRVQTGYRGSVSVYAGAQLLALPLPTDDCAWRYALICSGNRTPVEENGQPFALMTACEAPGWQTKAGFILPPPQGAPLGPAYELTLVPAAGVDGRIAAFPCATER